MTTFKRFGTKATLCRESPCDTIDFLFSRNIFNEAEQLCRSIHVIQILFSISFSLRKKLVKERGHWHLA